MTQNNGLSINEFDNLVQEIKNVLLDISIDNKQVFINVLDEIKEEMKKIAPKKNKLREYLNLVAPLISISNGIPELAENMQMLVKYMNTFIK